MRPFPYSLMIVACLLFQRPPAAKLFPIPENMEYEFPGVKLSSAETKLLDKALSADFANQDFCDKESPLPELSSAHVSLGRLGSGIIVKVNDPCICGTGGCPMFVYVREKGGYRTVSESFGWAFGVVPSETDVPDLVFASSAGGGLMTLTLQRYDGHAYVDHSCETLTAKEGFPQSQDDWWDPDKVSVSPCENFVPGSPRILRRHHS